MKYKKSFLIICLIVCFFSISSVCAGDADNQTLELSDDNVMLDNSQEAIISSEMGSFDELQNLIDNADDVVNLTKDYSCQATPKSLQISKNIVINGNGHYLDSAGQVGILIIHNGNVVLNNISFLNGRAENGAAIYIESMNKLTLNHVTFSNNYATDYGGAIYSNSDQTIDIVNCNFKSNTADDDNGGAIYAKGSVNIENSNFANNKAYLSGGAIYSEKSVSVKRSIFNSNRATGAITYQCCGGAITSKGTVKIENSTFKDNYAYDYGGAIYADAIDWVRSFSYFIANKAGDNDGGAIYTNTLSSDVKLGYFINNSADEDGGAIYICKNSQKTFLYCIFENNAAGDEGGAIYLDDKTSRLSLKYNYFVNNIAEDSGQVVYNYGSYVTIQSNWWGTPSPDFTKDLLVDDDDNKHSDSNPSKVWPIEFLYSSLINEIGEGGNITLKYSNYIYDYGPTINITKSGTIDGNGATIDMAECNIQVFNITADNVVIKNLNIKNANSRLNGGAIYFKGNNCSVINCEFNNNNANSGGAVYFNKEGSVVNCRFNNNNANNGGGAVYFNSDGSVTDCTFSVNKANNGDGGAVYFNRESSVVKCGFNDNYAHYKGGAVYFSKDYSLIGCSFNKNIGDEVGGAVYFNGNGSVTSCSFNNNYAIYNGGAVCFNKDGYVANCEFKDNSVWRNHGGAVYFNNGGSIIDSIFNNNHVGAHRGGAVYFNWDGSVTGCRFNSNTASGSDVDGGQGAAIFFNNRGTVSNSIFNNNNANHEGGAIYFSTAGTAVGCSFSNNDALVGGAILGTYYQIDIADCSFSNNHADNYGGAVYCTSNFRIANSSFVNNQAYKVDVLGRPSGFGGAVSCSITENAFIVDCTFVGNSAVDAAAIDLKNGVVNRCSFINNKPINGVVVYCSYNCNVDNNWWGVNNPNWNSLVSGSISKPSSYAVLNVNAIPQTIKTNSTSELDYEFYLSGTTDIVNIPTRNIELSSTGGKLKDKSGNIVNGKFSTEYTSNSEGSYEITAKVDNQEVKINVNVVDASFSRLIREIGDGGNITLKLPIYTYDYGGTINITKSGTIDGNGAIIDMAGSDIQLFNITADNVVIKNIIIKNVNFKGNGGAVYFNCASGTVDNCTFENVTAYCGGAIYFNGGSCSVINSIFYNNTATYGNDIYFKDSVNSNVSYNAFLNQTNVIYTTNPIIINDNWWGVNNPDWSALISGTEKPLTYAVLNVTANTQNISTISISKLKYTFLLNGTDNIVPITTRLIELSSTSGELKDKSGNLIDGEFLTEFSSLKSGNQVITAKVDNQEIKINVNVEGGNFSELIDEIGDGKDITLKYLTYGYDYGGTINITKSCTIDGNGAIIDMAGSDIRVFNITADNVVIKNLIIKNVNFKGNGGVIYSNEGGTVLNSVFDNNIVNGTGGAIYFVEKGIVSNCSFAHNTASNGGAIYGNNSAISNCSFAHNTASNGGAIYGNNSAISNCSFAHNTASNGGAIYVEKGIVSNCSFVYNSAHEGGAIHFNSNSSVFNCSFVNNHASNYGGAVTFNGDGIVDNSSFVNNTAKNSGAIYFGSRGIVGNSSFVNNTASDYAGAVTFNGEGIVGNSSFVNNNAVEFSGAIYFSSGGIVGNSSFVNNKALFGAAIYAHNFVRVEYSSFTNDIVFGSINLNKGSGMVSNCSFISDSGIYIFAINADNFSANGNWWGTNNPDWEKSLMGIEIPSTYAVLNVTADPQTVVLNSISKLNYGFYLNGTTDIANIPTRNIELSTTGGKLKDKSGYLINGKFSTEFTANAEGSYEITAKVDNQTIKINVTVDGGMFSKLIDEIGDGGDITLKYPIYLYDYGGPINITKSGTIDGNGAIIDMNGSDIQVFNITADNVIIKNLIIKNANFTGNGGAICFNAVSGTLNNCTFVNNAAVYGGAVYFTNSGIVDNCIFLNNTAENGSAIYFESNAGNSCISNSTLLNNSADSNQIIITTNNQKIYILFRGNNNLLNSIYSNHDITCTNVTYWSVNGTNNTGNIPVIPVRSENEAGQSIITFFWVDGDEIIYYTIDETDANGAIILDYPEDAHGDYTILAYHEGDSYYSEIYNYTTNSTMVDVTLIIDAASVVEGHNATLTVKLLPDKATGNVTLVDVNGLNITVNVTDGVANFILPVLPIGNYTFKVVYSGDANFKNATSEVNVTVHCKETLTIDVNDLITSYNSGEPLIATIINGNGPVRDVPVSVRIGNKSLGNLTTDSNGQITIPLNDLAASSTAYTVNFTVDTEYYIGNNSVNVTINKATPAFNVINSYILVGENDTIKITDITSDANPSFTNNSEDDNIVAVLDGGIVSGVGEGIGSVTVTLAESENYTALSKDLYVIVERKTVTIDANNISMTYGEYQELVANIKYNGTPVKETNVVIKVNGMEYDNLTTDADGKIAIPLNDWDAKYYTVEFDVNTNMYKGNNAANVTINKAIPIITVSDIDLDYNETKDINASSYYGAILRYGDIVNDTVISIYHDNVSGLMKGTASFTVSVEESDNYLAGSAVVNVTVRPADLELNINPSKITILVGDVYDVSKDVTVEPIVPLTCTVDKTDILELNDTIVTGLKSGTATVTVTAGDDIHYVKKSVNIAITVLIPTQVSVENATLDLSIGENATIVATTVPSGLNVAYIPDDSGVASIDENGVVTALKNGTATITVKVGGDGVYAENSTRVTVNVGLKAAGVTVNNSTLDLVVDDNFTIVATTTPEGLDVTYVPDDSGVVSVDENGVVTALKAGTAKITVKVGGDGVYAENSTTVTVTVIKANVTISIAAEDVVYPNDVVLTVMSDVSGNCTLFVNTTSPQYIILEAGVARNVNIEGLDAGEYEAVLSFAGDDKYNPALDKTTFHVDKNDTELYVITVDTMYPNIVYGAILTDCNDTVKIYVNDEYTLSIDVDDVFVIFNLGILDIGEYNITAVFDGNKNYNPVTNASTFRVTDGTITFTINTNATSFIYKETIVITHTLTEGATGTIKYYLYNGTVLGEADVSENFTLPVLDCGKYVIVGNYSGDNNYPSAISMLKLKIEKAPNTVIVNVENTTYGKDALITVTADADGKYLVDIDGATYDIDVNDCRGFRYLSLDAGNYSTKTTFVSDNYDAKVTEANFEVKKANNNIAIVTDDSTYGLPYSFHILCDFDGEYIANINNVPVNITVSDGIGFYDAGILDAGNYNVSINYTGDKNINPSNASASFTISKANVNITVEAKDVTSPSDVVVTAMADLSGNYTLFVDTTSPQYIVLEAGVAKEIPIHLGIGTYNITVAYAGDDNHNSSSASTEVTVKPQGVIIAEDIRRGVNSSYDYCATLVNAEGQPISDVEITFTIEGKTYKAKTNASGIATVSAGLTVKDGKNTDYTVTVTNPYTLENTTATTTIVPRLIVISGDLTADYLENPPYIVQAIGDDGEHVGANVTVRIVFAGFYYDLQTNETGHVVRTIGLAPGTYAVRGEYLGYKTEQTPFKVLQILKASSGTLKKTAKKYTLKATLKHTNGKAIAGAVVKLNFNGKTYKVKTNSKGVASYTIKSSVIKKLKAGKTYILKALYVNDWTRGQWQGKIKVKK